VTVILLIVGHWPVFKPGRSGRPIGHLPCAVPGRRPEHSRV